MATDPSLSAAGCQVENLREVGSYPDIVNPR